MSERDYLIAKAKRERTPEELRRKRNVNAAMTVGAPVAGTGALIGGGALHHAGNTRAMEGAWWRTKEAARASDWVADDGKYHAPGRANMKWAKENLGPQRLKQFKSGYRRSKVGAAIGLAGLAGIASAPVWAGAAGVRDVQSWKRRKQ